MSYYSNLHCDFADRAFEIQNAHGSLQMMSVGVGGLDMYEAFLDGGWSIAMIKKGNRIYVRYIPRELTQFLFDCYGT